MTTMANAKSAEITIPGFYAGKSILVTGATGFLGKVLIEKLLRSCPDVREIFLLMRPKRGVTIDERLRKMLSLPLFDVLREKRPSAFEKLVPVLGDVELESLGLQDVERRFLIERVSIIFHVAANVRFDENLKKDIFVNTRSTRDICILAKSIKNLAVLVHVSTAYAESDKTVVEERLYPCDIDWKKVIKVVESLDEHTVRIFSKKYLGTMPNTYTFSKKLAEQVISDYGKDLPCVIIRPSIVISSIEDPISGWIDNFNGPVGLMIGGGKGVVRVIYMQPRVIADFIPVDLSIKAILAAGWKRGMRTITSDNEVHVYNCAANRTKPLSMCEVVKMGHNVSQVIPFEGIIWRPSTTITDSRVVYFVLMLLFHIVPSLLIDIALKFSGRQPILFKIHRKIYVSSQQLSYFLNHEWTFKNQKFLDLVPNSILAADTDDFSFDMGNVNARKYLLNCLIGAKKYLLNEDMANLEKPKLHFDRMCWLDQVFKVLMCILLIWFLRRVGAFSYCLRVMESVTDGSIFNI